MNEVSIAREALRKARATATHDPVGGVDAPECAVVGHEASYAHGLELMRTSAYGLWHDTVASALLDGLSVSAVTKAGG